MKNTNYLNLTPFIGVEYTKKLPSVWCELIKQILIYKLFVGYILFITLSVSSYRLVTKILSENETYRFAQIEHQLSVNRVNEYQTALSNNTMQISNTIQHVLDTCKTDGQKQFMEKMLPLSIHVQLAENIPASAILAQAIYESGYGTSMLSKKHNNFFGIKSGALPTSPNEYVVKNVNTHNERYKYVADFKGYKTIDAGVYAYVRLVKKERYSSAWFSPDGLSFINALLESGYCPDTSYYRNVKNIITRHRLNELDDITTTTPRGDLKLVISNL